MRNSFNNRKFSNNKSMKKSLSILTFSLILFSISPAFSQSGSGEESGMRLIFFILLFIGVGAVFFLLTFFGSIGAIFYPALQSKPDQNTIVLKTGKKGSKKKRILIAYETKHGASADIATRIWEVLTKKGYYVDMLHTPHIFDMDISNYDAYIVGGTIYWSMYTRKTREFIKNNMKHFSKKPTALFMACGKMWNEFASKLEGDEAKWRRLSLKYLDPMLAEMPKLKPVDIGTFAGNLFVKYMNIPELIMMGVLNFKNGSKMGKYVDLKRVSKWTEELVKKLKI